MFKVRDSVEGVCGMHACISNVTRLPAKITRFKTQTRICPQFVRLLLMFSTFWPSIQTN